MTSHGQRWRAFEGTFPAPTDAGTGRDPACAPWRPVTGRTSARPTLRGRAARAGSALDKAGLRAPAPAPLLGLQAPGDPIGRNLECTGYQRSSVTRGPAWEETKLQAAELQAAGRVSSPAPGRKRAQQEGRGGRCSALAVEECARRNQRWQTRQPAFRFEVANRGAGPKEWGLRRPGWGRLAVETWE
ncbi:hypothetical protein NDU88_004011 [Pleurodeles waltl]|uniref:Uncharacterized protein n=1 Tax=Pleurodeles waltl TaxID=8319 RepID=A0AAV7V036_PLEWA|nr:hypothetical protein NDU88_004011 [Pleurodeles waltl]